jgi:hypothetical protein
MRLKDCIAVVGGARLLVKLFPRCKQALERACYYHTASFAALTGLISRVAQFFRPVQTFPALNFPVDINTHLAPMFDFPGTTIDGQTEPVLPPAGGERKSLLSRTRRSCRLQLAVP